MRNALLLVMALCLIALPAAAFHDGGVAHCNGCHTMHNSQDGAPIDPDLAAGQGNPWLLVDANPSEVCIACHDHLDATYPLPGHGYDVLNPPAQRAGGNFVFLDEDNLNDGHGGAGNPIPGDAAGHNLLAPGFGLNPDATLTSAPGGGFPSSILGCTSCHDPHGNQNFRFLNGIGPVQDGLFTFTAPAPTAQGISIFAGESDAFHTAYQGGMSAWCGNCHGDFHGKSSQTEMIHPSGSGLGGTYATAYGLYAGSDNITGGTATASYLAAVPFEDPANTTFSTAGPSATSQVSCITCHRAHASSAPDAGRWDFSVTFLEEDGHESGSYAIPNPYAASANAQRSLCNKCHTKDEFDVIVLDADL